MSLVKMICNFGGISCTWIHFEPINMGLLKINHWNHCLSFDSWTWISSTA